MKKNSHPYCTYLAHWPWVGATISNSIPKTFCTVMYCLGEFQLGKIEVS